jgi:hypothetical protein
MQAGVGRLQSPSTVHGAHWKVVVSQKGAAARVQSALVKHPQTVVSPVDTQNGSSGTLVQSELLMHCTHWPGNGLVVSQRGSRPAARHPAFVVHATHVSRVGPDVLQMGVAVLGFASQSVSLVHPTHDPTRGPLRAQTGVVPMQSASLVHARHVFTVVSQMGVVPPHAVSPPQAHGSPVVENCHSRTSCTLVLAASVPPVKPK